jgi:uncharacterized protein YndB with AHSA1/START domain
MVGVSALSIEVSAPREAVFAVLADARRYADWVVGTSSVRDADESFPARGSRFGARIAVGPLSDDAVTTVLECDGPRRLVLRTRTRRLGAAEIELELEEQGKEATLVTMRERAVGNQLVRLAQKLGDPLLSARNRRSLQRLQELVESGA